MSGRRQENTPVTVNSDRSIANKRVFLLIVDGQFPSQSSAVEGKMVNVRHFGPDYPLPARVFVELNLDCPDDESARRLTDWLENLLRY